MTSTMNVISPSQHQYSWCYHTRPPFPQGLSFAGIDVYPLTRTIFSPWWGNRISHSGSSSCTSFYWSQKTIHQSSRSRILYSRFKLKLFFALDKRATLTTGFLNKLLERFGENTISQKSCDLQEFLVKGCVNQGPLSSAKKILLSQLIKVLIYLGHSRVCIVRMQNSFAFALHWDNFPNASWQCFWHCTE